MHADPEDFGPDVESFARVLEAGSSIEQIDFDLSAPPPGLWDAIAAGIDDSTAAPATALPVATTTAVADRADVQDPSHGVVVDLAEHRRTRRSLVTAAAAVVLLVLGAVGIGLRSTDTAATEVVASTTLDVLEGPATASAKLIRSGDEERLIVTAEGMPAAPAGSHYELWLVDPEVTDPQSLGPMTGSTEVTVPASIDAAAYPVVDISLQQNGTEVHSGRSLLRGTLQ